MPSWRPGFQDRSPAGELPLFSPMQIAFLLTVGTIEGNSKQTMATKTYLLATKFFELVAYRLLY